MEAELKLRILFDDTLGSKPLINMKRALEGQRRALMEASGGRVGLSWDISHFDYSSANIQWRDTTYKGTDGVVRAMSVPRAAWTQMMTDTWREEADFLQMVIGEQNWKGTPFVIGGINYFYTQIVHPRESWSERSWKMTIEEELAHALDNLVSDVNFNALFDVRNYDNDVVHGEDPRYTRWDYAHIYEKLVGFFIKLFPVKKEEDMSKQLIKFIGDTDVFVEVAPFELLDVTNGLNELVDYGIAKGPVIELAMESRSRYKKVGVVTLIEASDL